MRLKTLRSWWRTITSRQNWVVFLSRGDRFFFLNGTLYLSSKRATKSITRNLADQFQGPGQRGVLFLRVDQFLLRPESLFVLPHCLLISGLGRFGNSIQQLLNSTALALQLELDSIFFYRTALLPDQGLATTAGTRFIPFRNWPPTWGKTPASVWKSDFFDSRFQGTGFSRPAILALRPTISAALSHLATRESTGDSVLTIHLRSGDIYGVKPHRNYGQPPLSFYRKVLESQTWDSVVVVTEDDLSPALAGIIEECGNLGLRASIVGADLDDALREITAATNLVASRGTLVPSLIFLFSKPRKIFYFGNDLELLYPDENLTVLLYGDANGQYQREILSQNWANSAQQRALMVSYPGAFIHLLPNKNHGDPRKKPRAGP